VWVPPHGDSRQRSDQVALFWGPLGWATRAAAGAAGVTIWRWCETNLPLTASAQWALRRFDHVVVGDPVCARVARHAGAAAVTVIGRAAVPSESKSAPARTPTIGWLSESRESNPFELFLLLRRLRSGMVGVCSRCHAPRVGAFDPWNASLRSPSCCGDVKLLAPIAARAEFVGPADPGLARHCARIIEWLNLKHVAGLKLASASDTSRIPSSVGHWAVQVSFDERPELPWSLIASAASEVPCVLSRFGAAADLDNPASVRALTRLTRAGAVRSSPDPAETAVRVHRLLTDPTFHKEAAESLEPIATAHSPATVDHQWAALIDELHLS
jgi:hypothetical protein